MPPRRKPQPSAKKPLRRSGRVNSATAMADSADPTPSPPPPEASPAAAKPVSVDPAPESASPAAKPVSADPVPPQAPEAATPAPAAKTVSADPVPHQAPEAATPAAAAAAAGPDLDGPPRRSATAGKLKKPFTDKLRAAAEERLARIPVDLRLRPLDPPPPSISNHEAALRALGLLDFARFDPGSEPPRPDLVAQLIAYYDRINQRSFVWDTRVSLNRTELANAFSLPKKTVGPPAPPRGFKTAALVSAALEFMRVCIHPWFTDCTLPQEVAGGEQTVKDGSPHKVNWAGIIWGIIEKEIHELPGRDDGVCQYGAYLQQLIRVQKPLLFELPQKEEAGKLVRKVPSDLVKDERDGDADARNKGLQELEPRDADADASSKGPKESELEGVSLTSKSLDESGPADADASGNDLKELESGDVRSNILEESETAGVDLRSSDLNESGDARSNILEEPETEGSDLRKNDLKKSDSGDAGSKSMDELADVDANAMSKSLDTSVVADGDAKGMGLDVEMESGDADANAGIKSPDTSKVMDEDAKGLDVEMESGDVDANAGSKSLDTSKVMDEDAKGLDVEMESGDADANAGSKSPDSSKVMDEDAKALDVQLESQAIDPNASNNSTDTLKVVNEDAKVMSLDVELESGDADANARNKSPDTSKLVYEDVKVDVDANASSNKLETPNVADEDGKLLFGGVDANASSNRLEPPNVADEDDELQLGDVERLETSKVADEDVKGMSLDQSKAGDAMVLEEAVGPTHEMNTVNCEVLADFAWEEGEDTIVGAAEKDACPSPEVELLPQEKVLVVPEEDEEAEEEEEKDEAGWSSANDDDDSMDVEDNVSVQNLDTDNEEAEESEHDAFEGCSGGVEMNWGIGDDKGGEGTTHCLQQCDFPGVEFENLNKGNVGMRDGVSFDDGFKMGSLHGMESNLLQAMNSDPATYNGTENAHDLSSGNFLAMGADAHKNGVDLGAGNSFFFGNNNGKRHVEDIDDGYDDQMQTQQQFLQGNQHKRMRNSSSSVPPGSAFFNANYSEPIQNLLVNASMLYEQKEREIQEALSQKQFMANLLQEKEAIIHSLNSARFEQENKLQSKLRCFEHDLNVMGQLVSGYKRALKQSHASFNEYRKKFPSNEFRYRDVPNGGGLVLSVRELERELERKRCEEEQQKIAAANEMIGNFKLEWLSKPDDWEDRINLLWRKTEGLARELDLLKEKRKAKLAALAREE
ncbi:uncharacterized protein [Triticum aestivum]|uniref:uncharacterized protein n=1 Tax=Triticum aestivum TaxID=4565 RepID=UPI000843C3B5|nr:uncharacterized protein LOC123164671 [Triticum aestivum]